MSGPSRALLLQPARGDATPRHARSTAQTALFGLRRHTRGMMPVVVQFRTVVVELHDALSKFETHVDRRFTRPTCHMTDRAKVVTLFFTR